MRRFAVTLVLASAAIAGLVAQTRPAPKPYTTWMQYAGGAHSSQFTALDQINKTQKQDYILALSDEEAETLSALLDKARNIAEP